MSATWDSYRDRKLHTLWMGGKHTVKEIAILLGTTPGSIDGRKRRLALPSHNLISVFWTPERCQELDRLYKAGSGPAAIAALWGVSRETIRTKIEKTYGCRRPEGAPSFRLKNDRGGLSVAKHEVKKIERELATEKHSIEMNYARMLESFADYADDVYEHHGPGPHYRDVSAWGGA